MLTRLLFVCNNLILACNSWSKMCCYLFICWYLFSESRVPWTKEALACLQTAFSREISECIFPGYRRIRRLKDRHPSLLKGRTEAQITARLQNLMKKWTSSGIDPEQQLGADIKTFELELSRLCIVCSQNNKGAFECFLMRRYFWQYKLPKLYKRTPQLME